MEGRCLTESCYSVERWFSAAVDIHCSIFFRVSLFLVEGWLSVEGRFPVEGCFLVEGWFSGES